jgi:hypothetical protein
LIRHRVPELDPGDLLLIEAVLGDEMAPVELFRTAIDDLAARVAGIESHAAVNEWIQAADAAQGGVRGPQAVVDGDGAVSMPVAAE